MPLELAAAEYGAGKPLLVLHGLFGSGRNWASVAQRLGAAHRVFALDLRNHGQSPWAAGMGYREMAEDVARFLRGRGLERAAILGHSMGGKAAMVLALTRPELVERLVVVDIAPVAYEPTLLAYVRAMRRIDLRLVARRADAEPGLAEAVPDAAERGFLLQNLVLDGEGARWRLNLAALEEGLPEISGFPDLGAARYDGKALFVAGGRSDRIRAENEAPIRHRFPAAEIVRIEAAGHWVHAEAPAEFLAQVAPFLEPREAP
jgi:esterase